DSTAVRPILELVNGNQTTLGSLLEFYKNDMQFGLIVNPSCGEYAGRPGALYEEVITSTVADFDNFIPILQIERDTHPSLVDWFKKQFPQQEWKAVIYRAEPESRKVLEWVLEDDRIYHHIFLDGKASREFTNNFAPARRVLIRDNFNKLD